MSKYKRYKHAKFRLYYHIIFSTKYRKKLLSKIESDIISYMKEAETEDFQIMHIKADKDHIHLLVWSKPNITISDIVHKLKQKSTYLCWKNHHDYMIGWYWSGKHNLWTRGYFVSTVGEISKDKVISYIENQG